MIRSVPTALRQSGKSEDKCCEARWRIWVQTKGSVQCSGVLRIIIARVSHRIGEGK